MIVFAIVTDDAIEVGSCPAEKKTLIELILNDVLPKIPKTSNYKKTLESEEYVFL
jgi:hypothetical protein